MSAVLYVVGTPIGNLGDLSPRAVEAFESCDFIAAEDTRVTLKLLNSFEIKKPMISYHEHNRFEMSPRIVARLLTARAACSSRMRVCPRYPTPARIWCECAMSTE